MKPSPQILFLCTANYYRSRFAELYCNHLAGEQGLPVRAESAGLEMARWRDYNPGELSPHTIRALEAFDVAVPYPHPAPKQFTIKMLDPRPRVIALSETEHRPMMGRLFPEALEYTEFWAVEDVEFESPEKALGLIRESVTRCLEEYRGDA